MRIFMFCRRMKTPVLRSSCSTGWQRLLPSSRRRRAKLPTHLPSHHTTALQSWRWVRCLDLRGLHRHPHTNCCCWELQVQEAAYGHSTAVDTVVPAPLVSRGPVCQGKRLAGGIWPHHWSLHPLLCCAVLCCAIAYTGPPPAVQAEAPAVH
jgi:hypothetical protein